MEEEIKNHKNVFAYPMLVLNPLQFDLRLVHQKKYETKNGFFADGIAIYLLVEACNDTDWFIGKYIHTYTSICCKHLIGKRVYFTFEGLKEKKEQEEEEEEEEEDK